MGNPAVFELSKCMIDNQIICIEDNIGEAIHLHIGSFRIDLTVNEFEIMANKLKNVMESLIDIEGFSVSGCDKFFLYRISREIPYLKKVYNKNVCIEELYIRVKDTNGRIKRILVKDSPLYRYIKGMTDDISDFSDETYIFESYNDRIVRVKNIIEKKQKNIDIVIDENGNILDGYISACILLNYNVDNFKVRVFEFQENHIPIIVKERITKKW